MGCSAWEARLIFAHNKEAVVSEKRNELEATVQLLSNQITAEATTQEMAAMTQRVATVARELASANSASSRFIPLQRCPTGCLPSFGAIFVLRSGERWADHPGLFERPHREASGRATECEPFIAKEGRT